MGSCVAKEKGEEEEGGGGERREGKEGGGSWFMQAADYSKANVSFYGLPCGISAVVFTPAAAIFCYPILTGTDSVTQ